MRCLSDTSQRMLNAIEPGSPLPIHRHQKTSEAVELSLNGSVVALNVPIGQWHTVRALESGSVILEMKNSPYEPIQDVDILQM